MSFLTLLFSNLDHFKRRFASVFLVGLVDGATLFCIPFVLSEALRQPSRLSIGTAISFLITLYLISLALEWILRSNGEALGTEYGLYLRKKYFVELERLPLLTLNKFHSGFILSLISRISDGAGGFLVECLWGISKSLANFTLFFIITARESVPLAIANTILLTLFVFVSVQLSKRMVPLSRELTVSRSKVGERYADLTANIQTVKKLGLREFAENTISLATEDNVKLQNKFQLFHANRWSLLHFMYGATYLGTLSFLLYQGNSQGNISNTSASIVLFIGTFQTLRTLVERMSEDFKWVLELNGDLRTLSQTVNLNNSTTHEPAKKIAWNKIEFEGVKFKYPANDALISVPKLEITREETTAILGASGQGKSTLLKLLVNFYEPSEGTRKLDATEYRDLPTDFFDTQLALVSQDCELFNLSILENIALGKKLGEAEVNSRLSELDLLDWVEELQDGLHTVVGERGLKLSSGQKQRLQLIRASFLEREIFLIDEPTAHLDKAMSERVLEFIEQYFSKKTVILAIHELPSSISPARSYEFKGGVLEQH
jgi:subfamily B ATP-binding cassette protein MsbA